MRNKVIYLDVRTANLLLGLSPLTQLAPAVAGIKKVLAGKITAAACGCEGVKKGTMDTHTLAIMASLIGAASPEAKAFILDALQADELRGLPKSLSGPNKEAVLAKRVIA